MSKVIGTVTKISGMAIVVDVNGNRHMLKKGEVLRAGDKLITASGASVLVKLANGDKVNFAESQTVKITDNLAQSSNVDVTENAVDQAIFDAVLTALNEGRDITEVLQDPAAGVVGSDGNASFVNVERLQTQDSSGANYDGGLSLFTGDVNAGVIPANFVFLIPAGAAPTVLLSQDSNNDGFISKLELNGANAVIANVGLPVGSEPGDSLNITDNNGSRSITITAADIARGFIAVQVTPLPTEGSTITVTASITNQSGQTSSSSSDSAVLDTAAPNTTTNFEAFDDVAPVVGGITNNSSTNDNLPEFKGLGATPDDVITVYNGNIVLATAVVKADGTWSTTPTTPLQPGPYSITTTITDAAGNESDRSSALNFTVDRDAPVKPTIDSVRDDEGAVQGPVASGGSTDDTTPRISGRAEANSTVEVFDGSNSIGTAIADANGDWVLQMVTPLLNGARELTVVSTDAAGNSSVPSDKFVINIDTNAPQAPSIVRIDDNVGSITDPIQKGGTTDDTTPTIVGTSGANLNINIYDNGVLIGSTTSNGNGDWSFTPNPALAEGGHNLTAAAVSAAGIESGKTGGFAFVVDITAPVVTAIQVAEDVLPRVGLLNNGDITDDNTPTISGTGEPGCFITIRDNGQPVGTTTVNPDRTWSFTPTLSDGPHSITVTISDAAGNTSAPTAPISFTVDTSAIDFPTITAITDNVAPVVDTVARGGDTNDRTPTVSGTAPAGAVSVEVFVNGSSQGTVPVINGAWTFTPATALVDGRYDFTALAINAAGKESTPTTAYSINVDGSAPILPTIEAVQDDVGSKQSLISNGGVTDDTTPTFIGRGEAGSTITLFDGASTLGTAVVQADGTWSYTPTTTLGEGVRTFTVVSTDKAGNVSPTSLPFRLTTDTEAPNKPSIGSVSDNEGAVQGPVASGGSTDDTTPRISGRAEANSTVEVFDGSNSIGTAIADANGDWVLQMVTPLLNGARELTVVSTDAAGNSSVPSDKFVINIDTNAPQAPSIVRIDDNVGSITDPIQKGGTTDDTTPTIVGTSGANLNINIYDNGVLIGSTTSNGNGDWSFTPNPALAEGGHNLTAAAVSAAGIESGKTGGFAFVVDITAPVVTAIQVAEDVLPRVGLLNNGDITDDNTPTISGTGEPGCFITIRDNGQPVGTTTVNPDRTWSFTPTLSDGPHSITVTISDAAGNTSAPTAPISFTVDTSAIDFPTITAITDNVAPVVDTVARGGDTNDRTPTVSGTAPAGAVSVEVFVNGSSQGTVPVINGAWTFTPATALVDGRYDFTALAINAAGKESTPTTAYSINVDGSAPILPTIEAVQDDVGSKQSLISNGGVTDDTTPTFIGRGEAGSTITLFDGASTLGTAVVQADGTWSYTPTTTLGEGVRTFTVVSTDKAGNVSPTSLPFRLTTDTEAPNKPSIGSVSDNEGAVQGPVASGGSTDDTTPRISGRAEANSTVEVFDGSNSIGTAIADANGDWVLQMVTPLLNGARELTVVSTDAAGNSSVPSDKFVINIDTNAPVDPNLIINGSFEDVTGLTTQPYGFSGAGAIPGWTDSRGLPVQIHNDQRGGLVATDGSNWLDLEASPSSNLVGQNVQGVQSGVVYSLTFSAGDIANADDGTAQDNTVTVYWGGQVVGTINPTDGAMSTYQFSLIGGAGNGNNRLEFEGGGRVDAIGASIDRVRLVPSSNLILNGSFEDVTGLTTQPYGFSGAGAIPGWTDSRGLPVQIHNDQRGGLVATDGRNWLDLEASPSSNLVGQNVQGVQAGVVYDLTFSAGDIANADDGTAQDNTVTVYWGGQVVGTINPTDGAMSTYQFSLIGGAGNGNNRLEFEGGGRVDAIGASIDRVRLVPSSNLILNGSFEDVTGLTTQPYGFSGDGAIPGWTDSRGLPVQVHNDQRGGLVATDGRNWLDLEASPGNNLVGQNVQGVQAGRVYELTFSAGDIANSDDGTAQDNTVTIYWGGQVVGTINPTDGAMSTYQFNLVGGAGNGNNRLEFEGGGRVDAFGASIDKVRLVATGGIADGKVDGSESGESMPVGYTDAQGDRITEGSDNVLGNGGNDDIRSGGGNDVVFGGDGNDTIEGGTEADTISGGGGDDRFIMGDFFGNDSIVGGEDGETQGDTLDFSTVTGAGVNVVLSQRESGTASGPISTATFSEIENFVLTNQNDSFVGWDAGDTVSGGLGNDLLSGGNGGADKLSGDGGNDTLLGGNDRDTLFGGSGDDVLRGDGTGVSGSGDDLFGGDGNDLIVATELAGASSGTFADGGSGSDTMFGGTNNDTLVGGTEADTISGGGGDDRFIMGDFFGNDSIVGGEDGETQGDTLDFSTVTGAGVNVVLSQRESGTASGPISTATFSEIENFVLTNQNDSFVGWDAGDTVSGGLGNDLLSGGNGGADKLSGDGGNDTLLGGNDRDTLFGGSGDDVLRGDGTGVSGSGDDLFGGDGNDLIVATELAGASSGTFADGGSGSDTMFGGTNNDTLVGGDGDDYIEGGAGDDFVDAGAGNDFVLGGEGIDVVRGREGNDYIDGGSGDDNLMGEDGDDVIRGRQGNEFIAGGAGNDNLMGEEGNDSIYGDVGDDFIAGGTGDDVIADALPGFATGGNDQFYGDEGNDAINGGDGNDTLVGGSGADLIEGGAGNDLITFDNALRNDEDPRTEGAGDRVFGGAEGAADNDVLDLRGAGAVTIVKEADPDDAGAFRGTVTFANGGVLAFAGIETILADTVIDSSNLILNGSFEDVTGLTTQPYGFSGDGAIPGWTDSRGLSVQVHNDQRGGLVATDGRNWLDLEASPGNNLVGQNVQGVQAGRVYELTFSAGDIANSDDGTAQDNTVTIYWGGQVVGTINPTDGAMSTYQFNLVGGAGNGNNRLEFEGGGRVDAFGASIDKVRLVATGGIADGKVDGSESGESMPVGYTDAQGDRITEGSDNVLGNGGNDDIRSGGGNDVVFGGDGNDTIEGGTEADTISGGGGDDRFIMGDFFGNDSIVGGEDGETQGDTLDFSTVTGAGVNVVLSQRESGTASGPISTATFSEIENFVLTNQNDSFVGWDAGDTVSGGLGNDLLSGGNGGADKLSGDGGNDTLLGGNDRDTLFGGSGDDVLRGDGTGVSGSGDDLFGGDGNDLIVATELAGASSGTFADGGSGSDTMFGGTNNDTLVGGTEADTISGGGGDDRFIMGDFFGNDSIVGGEDGETQGDTLDFSTVTGAGVNVVLSQRESGTASGPISTATFSEIENFVLTNQNDSFVGWDAGDTVSGGLGNDLLSGGNGGADKLSGDGGNDTLLGGNDRDTLFGGSGDDVLRGDGTGVSGSGDDLFGGDGNDLIVATELAGASSGTFADGGSGSDTMFGGTNNDTLVGGDGDDYIEGGAGDDFVDAGAGNDFVLGGEGIDVVRGREGNDYIDGGSGDDNLMGEDGDDVIRGRQGNEFIAGGAGNDNLMGEEGNDSIYGDVGDDFIAGGTGDDVIADALPGFATGGNDQFYGDEGNDAINGGDGNDTLVGGSGADLIEGGAGNDLITFDNALRNDEDPRTEGAGDRVFGGAEGAADNDVLDLRGAGAVTIVKEADPDDAGAFRGTVTFANGGVLAFAGIETILADTVIDSSNLILNGSFEDVTGLTTQPYGFSGDGAIPGWTDSRGLSVQVHNDQRGGLVATDGRNWLDLEASPGNNLVGQNVQGVQAGRVYELTFSAGDIANSDDGTAQDNTVTIYWGGQVVGTINPTDGAMSTYQFNLVGGAGNGNNRLEFEGGGRVDAFGASIDKVRLVATGGIADGKVDGSESGESMPVGYTDAQGDRITEGSDNVLGNGGNDDIRSGGGNDVVFGGDGNDVLSGGLGNDFLAGDAGDDQIFGDEGNDGLRGGLGNDYIDGGTGNDSIFGNVGDDVIRGRDGEDLIEGGEGNDNLMGEQGDDRVFGDAGDDFVSGQAGDDEVDGGGGNDSVSGGDGNDIVRGGAGDDLLIGGAGADLIEGGAGNDTITFNNPFTDAEDPRTEGGGDRVFGGAEGAADNDVLDLRGAGAVTIAKEADPNDAGAFRGTATFANGSVLSFAGIETILADSVIASNNLIQNGSFENVTGLETATYGFVGRGVIPGWTDPNRADLDVVNNQRDGILPTDGSNWLDLDGKNQNVAVGQNVQGVVAGQAYRLSFDAGDYISVDDNTANDNTVTVLWGGVKIATINPTDGSMSHYEFDLVGGAGNGNNRLEFVGGGPADSGGVSIDSVSLVASNVNVSGLIYYSTSNGNVGLFNPTTGAVNVIGNAGKVFLDVAQNSKGQLFGVTYEVDTAKLYTINTQTGVSTFLLNINNTLINSLAGDSANNLYAVSGNGALLRISPSGTISTLGNIGVSEGDLLVIGNNVYLSRTDNVLVKYDLSTNQVSNVANLPEGIFGLAQNPNGNIYAIGGDGKVYDVNPATGAVNFTGTDVNVLGDVNGVTNIAFSNIADAGDNLLVGTSSNDVLSGLLGNDTLIGGAGNDTLSGGAGVDVFRWGAGDAGLAGQPAKDTILDFDTRSVAQGGDVLDIRDLLQGESANNLQNYLHFEKSGSDTIVNISSTGGFANDPHTVSGNFSSGNTTQQIVLSGVDLTAGQSSDAAIINNLLSQQKLIVDQ